MMGRRPKVVIVGRPNVGKSTLLNRIIGRREAIVEERPGVTRDRKEVLADWAGREFNLIDTGGWLAKGSELEDKVSSQSDSAISEADVVLLVLDAMVGVTDEDHQMVRRMRAHTGPLLVVANKVDDERHQPAVWDLMTLGLGEPFPVSSLHGRGVGDLLDAVVEVLPEETASGLPAQTIDNDDGDRSRILDGDGRESGSSGEEERLFSIALVGRPNVGKSTLFNRLIGAERSVVHDMPGTTRDTVDTVVETPNGRVRFLDTAGMRRRSRIDEDTEYYSVVRALKAVDSADVAILVIDATEGVTQQDQRLAERVDAAGCPIVVALNKIELLTTEQRENLSHQVKRRLSFLPGVPVHRISARSGKGVHKLLPSLEIALNAYRTRVPTRKVNEVLRTAQQAQPAPGGARVLYATQGATDPPTFTLFTNRNLPESYLRFLERQLREAFELGPTPIKMRVRRRSE
jgi:GTP-binding protein